MMKKILTGKKFKMMKTMKMMMKEMRVIQIALKEIATYSKVTLIMPKTINEI